MKSEKRTYHPLVMYMYFTGKLDKKYIEKIPSTTLQYWKTLDHTSMYGYEWVENTYDNLQKLELTTQKKMIRSTVQVCGRLYNAISSMQDLKEYRSKARKNSSLIVRTIDAIAPHISLKKSCKLLKISEQQYYRWKNKINCTASILNLCFKVHPNQLTIEECAKVQLAVTNPLHQGKPLLTTYYSLMRSGTLCCSMSTFYKYARLLGAKRVFNKTIFRERNTFRASQSFEYIHIDTTKIFTQQQGWQRAVFVKDNYSKCLLHKAIVPSAGSLYIKEVIQQTFKKHDLFARNAPVTIISDNGTENKGELSKWILGKQNKMVCRVIAKINSDISNNMVESANHQFKNIFLKNKVLPKTKDELHNYLEEFEKFINYEWTPGEFYGLTPFEVLQGELPDKYKYSSVIRETQNYRIIENRLIELQMCENCGNVNANTMILC